MRHLPLAALLIATLTTAAPAQTPVTVPGGSAVPLTGTNLTISLTDVQDVRCPSDVDCVWEGTVRVALLLTDPDGQSETLVLCNICQDATRRASAMGHDFTYLGLHPGRDILDALGRETVIADYAVDLGLD